MSTLKSKITAAEKAIRKHAKGFRPKVGLILGTGLGSLAGSIKKTKSIPFKSIPGFGVSKVQSHAGNLLLGELGGKPVVAMQGRYHWYEGWSLAEVTFPVRVMKALGIETLIVSNACGGMNPNWDVGDLMVIDDHINMMGDNPLRGDNDDALGPRFPDMSAPYDHALSALAQSAALDLGIRMQKGVYVAVGGPNLETRAEYRMLRAMGADVVGMSTVPEVIVARHQGTRVLGLSVITDRCLPAALHPTELSEILKVAEVAEPKLASIVVNVLERMPS